MVRNRKYKLWNRKRCPHSFKYGIYGDAVNILGGRLFCPDSGRILDGPVTLSDAPLPGLTVEFTHFYDEIGNPVPGRWSASLGIDVRLPKVY